MLKRLGPLPRFLLGMAGLLILLALTAGLWWWLPAFPRTTLPATRGPCFQTMVSANGQTLVVVCGECLAVWDLGRRQEVAVIPYDEWGEAEIVLAPDGQKLAIAGNVQLGRPPHVRLWHFATQPRPISLPDSDTLVGFTAHSTNLIVRHGDGYKLWDTATARKRALPPDSPSDFDVIHPLRDGRWVVSRNCTEPGWLLNQHRTDVWTVSADLRAVSGPVILRGIAAHVTPSPDGQLLAASHVYADCDLYLKLFESQTGRQLAFLPINAITQFSPDGSRLLTSEFQTHTVWDTTTMPPRRIGSVEAGHAIVSPDGRWLAVASAEMRGKTVLSYKREILDAATLANQGLRILEKTIIAPDGQSFAHPTLVESSSFRQLIAKWLAGSSAREHPAVQVCQLPGGREIASFAHGRCCTYFPDGLALAVGREDGPIEIWDIPPRRPWWVEYGLPVVFALLLLLGVRLVWRSFRKPAEAKPC